MTRLDFTTAFRSIELQQLDIPVEVRASNLSLVARTTTSRRLTVDPGAYYVSARLPSGHELGGFVEAEGDATTVELSPDPGEAPPPESMEPVHYLTTQSASVPLRSTRELEQLGPGHMSQVSLRWIRGNLFSGEVTVEDGEPFTPAEDQPVTFYPENDGPTLVQLRQPSYAPLTIATPAWSSDRRSQQSTLTFARHAKGHWTFDVQLAHRTANLLLHYRARGYASQAAQTLDSPQLAAEKLLRGKRRDPIAAAVGAYALLRLAELERLHDWTENLFRWFPGFPDGAAIVGEHLARKGRHDEAVEAFVALAERGVPLFSDGFSFALDRLRLYLGSDAISLTSAKHAQAAAILEPLKLLAPLVDFGQPILTMSEDPLGVVAVKELPA